MNDFRSLPNDSPAAMLNKAFLAALPFAGLHGRFGRDRLSSGTAFTIMTIRILFALGLLLPLACFSQHITKEQFSGCIRLEHYEFLDVMPFPGTPTTRELTYGGNKIVLSVEEAYRIRYSWKGTKFLDVKIEYPGEEGFEADLRKLIAYYEYQMVQPNLRVTYAEDSLGYLAFFADRPEVSPAFVFLSLDLLVDRPNKRFIYVYYWNPNKEQLLLTSMDAFYDEKRQSMREFLKCLR
ncbi:MAG: hypothetical protein EOP49_15895 [Sphingobacteriales bacterium]|nr:MAG: hypothetical protein EOP49_15895 [Sphingobacteriales bacterium]